MSRRGRKAERKERGDDDGGPRVDHRWVDEDKATERVKFLENLKLSSFKPLEDV